jgi:hypothetical protein
MQKAVMGILITMFVASLVLAVAAFVLPTPAAAGPVAPYGCPRYWCDSYTIYYGCGSCGPCCEKWESVYYCCQNDYCAGMPTYCWVKDSTEGIRDCCPP